jgi:hypothetical protein
MCEYLFAQFTLRCSTDEVLSRYFVHSGETADQITVLARTAKHLMNWVMRPLGSLLTTLPMGPERPGVLATGAGSKCQRGGHAATGSAASICDHAAFQRPAGHYAEQGDPDGEPIIFPPTPTRGSPRRLRAADCC